MILKKTGAWSIGGSSQKKGFGEGEDFWKL